MCTYTYVRTNRIPAIVYRRHVLVPSAQRVAFFTAGDVFRHPRASYKMRAAPADRAAEEARSSASRRGDEVPAPRASPASPLLAAPINALAYATSTGPPFESVRPH